MADVRTFLRQVIAELDRRDDSLNPIEGFYVDLEVTPFVSLAGTDNGARVALDARGYHTAENLTFAARVQLGSLIGPDLANSDRFIRPNTQNGAVRRLGHRRNADISGQSLVGGQVSGLPMTRHD